MQILLVENKQLYADYLKGTLREINPDVTVDLVDSIQELKEIEEVGDYQYAIVDTGLYDRSALEAIRFLLQEEKNPEVIALADIADPSLISDTFKYQVMAYVSNNDPIENFQSSIQKCLKGDRQHTRKTRKIMRKWVESHVDEVSQVEVSKREREILRMICQEKTSVEIAEELFISEHTVLTHRKNLLKKVGAKNTVGLVKYAIAHKLLAV